MRDSRIPAEAVQQLQHLHHLQLPARRVRVLKPTPIRLRPLSWVDAAASGEPLPLPLPCAGYPGPLKIPVCGSVTCRHIPCYTWHLDPHLQLQLHLSGNWQALCGPLHPQQPPRVREADDDEPREVHEVHEVHEVVDDDQPDEERPCRPGSGAILRELLLDVEANGGNAHGGPVVPVQATVTTPGGTVTMYRWPSDEETAPWEPQPEPSGPGPAAAPATGPHRVPGVALRDPSESVIHLAPGPGRPAPVPAPPPLQTPPRPRGRGRRPPTAATEADGGPRPRARRAPAKPRVTKPRATNKPRGGARTAPAASPVDEGARAALACALNLLREAPSHAPTPAPALPVEAEVEPRSTLALSDMPLIRPRAASSAWASLSLAAPSASPWAMARPCGARGSARRLRRVLSDVMASRVLR